MSFLGPHRTPEQKEAKRRRKEAERARRAEELAIREAERQQEIANFPEFIVRETREVAVKAENLTDAIALASAAFKYGQDGDNEILRGRPWGIDGDTADKIRTTNIKAVELED